MKIKIKRRRIKYFIPTIMSDISFLLLIFFIISSTPGFENKIDLTLPLIKNVYNLETNNIEIIHIDKDENIYLNYQKISLKNFYNYLKSISKLRNKVFEIRADENTKYAKIDLILKILKLNGFSRVNFILKKYNKKD